MHTKDIRISETFRVKGDLLWSLISSKCTQNPQNTIAWLLNKRRCKDIATLYQEGVK